MEDNKSTIMYICQYCGRFIKYMVFPCTRCLRHPETEPEMFLGVSLGSSNIDSMANMLAIGREIRFEHTSVHNILGLSKEDLQIALTPSVASIEGRELISQLMAVKWGNKPLPYKINTFTCGNCGIKIDSPIEQCKMCSNPLRLSELQKWELATISSLSFIEDYVDCSPSEDEKLYQLVMMLLYFLTIIKEKSVLPSSIQIKELEELLVEIDSIMWLGIGNQLGNGMFMDGVLARLINPGADASNEGQYFCENLNFILSNSLLAR